MKTSAFALALVAGALGFGSLASAQTTADQAYWGHDPEYWRGAEARANDRPEERSQSYDRRLYQAPSATTTPQNAQRYSRGGYLPREYYRNHRYYVQNWRAYRNQGLYAPPRGYQWMNVDGNLLLVALANGQIANALRY